MAQRVCIVGLDCAAPELVFERWGNDLPHLKRIREAGVWGKLESVTPPITVPAWMCMMTGKDPGTLGIYGFRNRRDNSYDGLNFASSRLIHEPTLWDILAQQDKSTVALGVPLTYPPKPMNGWLVSDFLAPDTDADYTFPPELKEEIRQTVGEYIFDTREFRTDDKARLLNDIYTMTRQRFALAKHFLVSKPHDFFIMVEMGPDRIHHGFWRFFDPTHPKYERGNPFENAIRDYYVMLDGLIGDLVATLDADTRLLIVSDHGAKRMDGGLCFNDWLIREGYLVLKETPATPTKFSPALVDWTRTQAWGDGGYYGRCFLNIAGREPNGIVAPERAEQLKMEIAAKLEDLTDDAGNPMHNRVFRPEEIYAECRNVPPDLIVYFGDLHWRSVGTVGNASVWTHENDTGPDDANHAQHGIFLMADVAAIRSGATGNLAANERIGLSLLDIAPTVLEAFGIAVPAGMGRQAIAAPSLVRSDSVYTQDEEAELARRLEDLGYL